MKNDLSFLKEQQIDENDNQSLTDEDKAQIQMVGAFYGQMPDSLVELSLVKMYPQLLYPFMYMAIRIIVSALTVFA